MSSSTSILLEIVKISIPALIVFATAYYLIKKQIENAYQLKSLEVKQSAMNTTVPLKMQAYERLAMLCERSEIPSLLSRFYKKDLKAKELLYTMLAAAKQEYDHNITQQVYVSDNLWKIIQVARNQNIAILESIGESIDLDASAEIFREAIAQHFKEHPQDPLVTARSAIRKEASILL
ncbi:MAG: hypothetical protein KJP00_16685 [Bacteroidia bacterium]|nr:hypothetical protein [Bacteroidia bacterium]